MTTVTVNIRNVGFVFFVACKAIIQFYTNLQRVSATSAENSCGHDACGDIGSGCGCVSSLRGGFCIIGAFDYGGLSTHLETVAH